MKVILLSLLVALTVVGCAKPPEQVFTHPKTGQTMLAIHVGECGDLADRFGVVNMSPVHQYPMNDMKDHFQREKVFRYCMLKKGYEDGESYIVDETTTTINVADSFLAAGETSLVTIAFHRAVGGLENSDLTVANGTLSHIHTADRGLTWTAVFTPLPGLEAFENVIALDNSGVINAVSNPGIGITVSNNYSIDSLRPTVAIKIRDAHVGNVSVDFVENDIVTDKDGRSTIVTFTFSEAPIDFVLSDISSINGTISALVRDDATHYHATFIAEKNFVGRGSVTVNATKFTDAAHNQNPAATPAIVAINTLRPTITAGR